MMDVCYTINYRVHDYALEVQSMVTITLRDEQVLELVCQLPSERRAWLFRQLLQDEWSSWADLSAYGAERARAIAAARGLNWNRMTEIEREDLVDTLLHEPDA